MKSWDLTSGAAKLEQAVQALRKAADRIEEHWDDKTYHSLKQQYLLPLEPKVRAALDAIRSLDEVLLSAERACRSD